MGAPMHPGKIDGWQSDQGIVFNEKNAHLKRQTCNPSGCLGGSFRGSATFASRADRVRHLRAARA